MNEALKTCDSNIEKSSVIAIIAGSGDLPNIIAGKLEELKRDYVVVSIEGFGSKEYPSFGIGEIGRLLDFMRDSKVSKVLFCGGVKRPSLLSLKLDSVGKEWLKRLGVRAFLGDDALLKGVKKLLEKEGITVISPQSVLETLLTPRGILTKSKPKDMDLQDIARGMFVLNAVSKADIGQAVVVQEGVVLGLEAAEGTNALIRRSATLKISRSGGVLVKTSKLNQDKGLDLPTIGKDTIIEAYKAKLSGLAIGAERSQIINSKETIELADKYELFVIGV